MRTKLLSLSLLIVLISCEGIKYTFKGGIIPGKTFSMNSFPNNANTVYPNLSFMVFDAMRQKLLSESTLKFLDGDGDAHFEGTIVGYDITPVQATGAIISELSRLTIRIKVSYTNKINPKINYDKTFSDFDDFDNSEDFNNLEEQLVTRILKKLIDQIYNEAMEEW